MSGSPHFRCAVTRWEGASRRVRNMERRQQNGYLGSDLRSTLKQKLIWHRIRKRMLITSVRMNDGDDFLSQSSSPSFLEIGNICPLHARIVVTGCVRMTQKREIGVGIEWCCMRRVQRNIIYWLRDRKSGWYNSISHFWGYYSLYQSITPLYARLGKIGFLHVLMAITKDHRVRLSNSESWDDNNEIKPIHHSCENVAACQIPATKNGRY